MFSSASIEQSRARCIAHVDLDAFYTQADPAVALPAPAGLRGRYANIHFFRLMLVDSGRLVPQHWNIVTGHFLR
ncbi:hypothetical protein HaLaN_19091, partial [Haematococcus lacustris]